MANKKTTVKIFKKWIRVTIKTMIVSFLLIGIYLILTSLNLTAPTKEVLFAYDIEQNPTYKVNIFDNNYIDEESLFKNENYITNLVSNIDLNFNYIYEAIKPGDYDYDYNIIATLYGEIQGSNNENSKLWTKEYVLLDKESDKALDTNAFNIEKSISLDFQKYNNEVINFKNDLDVPINAYLEVVMNINVVGNSNNNVIKDTKTQKFSIPLNQIAFSIKKNVEENDHQEIVQKTDKRASNMYKFNIGILMIVYSFSLFAFTYKYIFISRNKSKFDVELERILKSYGDVIIELASNVNLENKEIVYVKSFNEMVDLEEELRIPINFIRTEKNKGEFFIINNDICYKWCLM